MMSKETKERSKWSSVNVLTKMIEEIRKIIPQIYGFNNVAEYIHDAIRRKLDLDKARVQMEKDEEEE